ncbi:MAG: YlmH/Sll1252 family protein [Butyricicoccus sp.]|nr:YlmH/Sll1252 family protein [Butyricicoccus sp.]
MENDALLRRAEDLARRCEKNGEITHSHFLSPAEQAQLKKWAQFSASGTMLFHGGREQCERCAAFFLPYWMEAERLEPGEFIRCVEIKAGFGEPGHRDYLGAILGLGVDRQWLGDIWIAGDTAWVFCLPSVEGHLLASLDKVGRFGVKTRAVPLDAPDAPEVKRKRVSFTVQSARLDAAAAGLFSLSRAECARLIAAGELSLNYEVCLRPDATVKEGDVLSLRGHGKGEIVSFGGVSRKGRMFLECDRYI